MISGETLNISQFCELQWLEWIMSCDETTPFPDYVLKLGCYLGSIIDVEPAMT